MNSNSPPTEFGRKTDPIGFAVCSSVALIYHELYHDLHYYFIKCELTRLIQQLKLPAPIGDTIFAFQRGYGYETLKDFIEVLRAQQTSEIMTTLFHWCLNGDNGYDARSRAVLSSLAIRLDIKFIEFEDLYAANLKAGIVKTDICTTISNEKRNVKKGTSRKRIAIISAATVAGAGLCALTAGLAAPLVATGIGTLLGTSATLLGSTAGIAVMTTVFGAAGGGLAGYKMKRRIGGLEEFRFLPIRGGQSLHMAIAVSGWTGADNLGFTMPWKKLHMSAEQVSLVWESRYLKELGTAIDRLIGSAVVAGVGEVLKLTALSGLVASLALPAAVISATSLVDNPWSVCTQRAKQAGEELALILKQGIHGKRPVSLIGCSTGALVIWNCLQELAKTESGRGIVSDTILLGAPVTTKQQEWEKIRSVVSGRLINGWTESDWVLGLLCHDNVAGTTRVNWAQQEDKRLINIRLTGTISGHTDYQKKMTKILRLINACQAEFKVNKFRSVELPFLSRSTSCSTRSSMERSKSMSSFPKQRLALYKIRRTQSMNNL